VFATPPIPGWPAVPADPAAELAPPAPAWPIAAGVLDEQEKPSTAKAAIATVLKRR
jgi:hypothetical protein